MALALAFVSLALISGIAYIVVLAGATGTAERLLVDRAARVVEAQVEAIQSRLDPVTEPARADRGACRLGRIDIKSPVAMREALWAMMRQVPAVSSAAFGTLDLRLYRVVRRLDGSIMRDDVSLLDTAAGLRAVPRAADQPSHLLGRIVLERDGATSRCSMCARRSGASTMPSSAA